MIKARKSKLFDAVFYRYTRRLLRQHFAAIRVAGHEHLNELDGSLPVIGSGNHSSWWDGLIVYFLSHALLDREIYLMMEERQLARYRFFSLLGAFSVHRENPASAATSIRYAAGILSQPNRWLWIYPQGIMQPNDHRPLHFFPGAAVIARLTETSVQFIPFAHRYEFLNEQRPEAFVRLGSPLLLHQPIEVEETTRAMERCVTELLEKLRQDIAAGRLDEYRVIFTGKVSTNIRYDRILGRS